MSVGAATLETARLTQATRGGLLTTLNEGSRGGRGGGGGGGLLRRQQKAAEVSRSYRCVYGAAEGLFPTLQAQGGGNEGRQGQRRQ